MAYKFIDWKTEYLITITNDFVLTYNTTNNSLPELSFDEGYKILNWVFLAIHKLNYLNILKEDGSTYESDEFHADLEIQTQLASVLKHNIFQLVNSYKEIMIFQNIDEGRVKTESKFNPIDNAEDILDNFSNAANITTNKHSIAYKQNQYIKYVHALLGKIKSEFEQYLEVYN